MSSDSKRRRGPPVTANSRSRRLFLKESAFVAAGASASVLLPAAAQATADGAGKPTSGRCAEVKSPMRNVKGKVAFVTGAASGIGQGIAKAFVNAGMKVAIADINEGGIKRTLAEFAAAGQTKSVHGIRVNVTDRAAMEKAAAETVAVFGKVHVLVNNAGVIVSPPLAETSYKDWDWLLDVNLNGPFNGIRAFMPLIRAHNEGGHIITTSSILGLFTSGGAAAYVTSKYGVVGMMEALRAELASTNIGVSVFCPGTVTSNIEESSHRDRPENPGLKDDTEAIKRTIEARRNRQLFMDPTEVGQLVLRGMRNNDLYILTHAEYEAVMRARNEALIASIPADVPPTPQRDQAARSWLKSSIYVTERDRKRCGRSKA